jgi:DNA-binding NarL/FixJ family response regulator
MDSESIRILIVDDHSLLRRGIINSLSASLPEAEFGEAGNAAETIRSIKKERWDLVILDINIPDRNGLDVLKEIKENYPEIPVIIFSMYPEDQFALRSIRAGASAYLTKDISVNEFAKAIRRIIKGERYLTSTLMELITNEIRDDHKSSSHELLSDREYQVFLMIASGLNISMIAKKLFLSVKTVSVYRSHILQKMNLKNNSEITHYAFQHDLVK